MNKILSLYVFGLSLVILSCSQNVPSVIKGNLTNINDTSITIEIGGDPITGLEPFNYQKVHKLSKEGAFSIPIETSFPVQVVLYSENFVFFARVFLFHGGEITLNADCSDTPETLNYRGVSANLNTFEFELIKYEAIAYREIRKNIGSLTSYEKSLDSIQAISITMLDDFQKKEHLSKDELLWLSSNIKYGKYSKLANRAYQLNLALTDSAYQIFQTLDLNDHKASLISSTYNNLILRYILYEVNLGGITYSDSDDKREFYRAFYDIINEKLTGSVRDATLTAFLSEMLKNNNHLAEEYYSFYLADCKSPKMIEKTSMVFQKYLTIGHKPLSDSVILIPTNHQSPMEVLSQFDNKIILMDFWASWCSPCIKGLPFTKKLSEDYQNQDIEVIYVGNKDQESNLINAIKEHHLSGKHIILNEEESDIWREEFNITGIPTYVLMNKDGQVLSMANPHKMTDGTYALIDSLLLVL